MRVVYLRDQRSMCTFDDFWLDEIRDKQEPVFSVVTQLLSRERRKSVPQCRAEFFRKETNESRNLLRRRTGCDAAPEILRTAQKKSKRLGEIAGRRVVIRAAIAAEPWCVWVDTA